MTKKSEEVETVRMATHTYCIQGGERPGFVMPRKEWEYLKGYIASVTVFPYGPVIWHTIGSLCVGAGLSLLIQIFAIGLEKTQENELSSKSVFCLFAMIALILIGAICMLTALMLKKSTGRSIGDVKEYMSHLEAMYWYPEED